MKYIGKVFAVLCIALCLCGCGKKNDSASVQSLNEVDQWIGKTKTELLEQYSKAGFVTEPTGGLSITGMTIEFYTNGQINTVKLTNPEISVHGTKTGMHLEEAEKASGIESEYSEAAGTYSFRVTGEESYTITATVEDDIIQSMIISRMFRN